MCKAKSCKEDAQLKLANDQHKPACQLPVQVAKNKEKPRSEKGSEVGKRKRPRLVVEGLAGGCHVLGALHVGREEDQWHVVLHFALAELGEAQRNRGCIGVGSSGGGAGSGVHLG